MHIGSSDYRSTSTFDTASLLFNNTAPTALPKNKRSSHDYTDGAPTAPPAKKRLCDMMLVWADIKKPATNHHADLSFWNTGTEIYTARSGYSKGGVVFKRGQTVGDRQYLIGPKPKPREIDKNMRARKPPEEPQLKTPV